MAAIRDFSYSPERSCAFAAVVSTPLPMAFVSMRRSPSFAEELESTLSGLTNPVTASPYFGSGSSMVWPPQSMAPASSTLSAPPASIAFTASWGSFFDGKQNRLSASLGVPPIAYMSLRAFAAATCPKVYGSSTIGGKKSTVCIMAVSSFILYTAASSAVSKPTISFGSEFFGRVESIASSTPGPILAAHPPQEVIVVKRTSLDII